MKWGGSYPKRWSERVHWYSSEHGDGCCQVRNKLFGGVLNYQGKSGRKGSIAFEDHPEKILAYALKEYMKRDESLELKEKSLFHKIESSMKKLLNQDPDSKTPLEEFGKDLTESVEPSILAASSDNSWFLDSVFNIVAKTSHYEVRIKDLSLSLRQTKQYQQKNPISCVICGEL